MSSAVAELDAYLQSMLTLKAPGVSGSKINSITSLCTANVQSESVLIQKIYTHFKKAPGTHKLGVLYVVDSVTRKWVEEARKSGQPSGNDAPDGTFAAGVTRVTELLPVLMTDIINNAPEDQKARIKKLVDIWERGSTFPMAMLSSFKDKLNAPVSGSKQPLKFERHSGTSASRVENPRSDLLPFCIDIASTTPEGSPAPDFIPLSNQHPDAPPPPQNTSAILAALANMAKQNTAAPSTSGIPAQASSNNLLNSQIAVPQTVPSSVDQAPLPSNGQAVNPFAGNLAAQFAGLSNGAQNQNQNQSQNQSSLSTTQNPLASMLPQAGTSLGPEALQQVQLLQLLAAQGIPQDQWATALQILNLSNNTNAGVPSLSAGSAPNLPQPGAQNTWGGRNEAPSRDHDPHHDYMRSPTSTYRRRSRSPGWDRRRDVSPPRRRDSPVYGDYHGDSPGRARGDARDSRGRGGRGTDYRQRSPPGRRRRSPTPPRQDGVLPPPGPKFLEWDYSIGQGNIKVLSRTLFVGGVTSSESHLRSIFSAFGIVQTCIVNIDKRHAFVKMINRRDAVTAREGMEQYKSGDMQLRTRWGVGFGPRDCSDYQTGISVIPIERLTDADRKWMLTAEYGGSGGKPIETGMVVEEPDIEIGAGVSSKAISRRMATDQGGKRGPQSSRINTGGGGRDRFRNPDRHDSGSNGASGDRDSSSNANSNTIGVPPAVPGFGFSFPGMPNGLSMFPPGFMMGGAPGPNTSAQPPPPGHGN